MRTIRPSRVALVGSLLVLGVSIAVFASVTGVASVVTPDPGQEFRVEDGALVESTGTGQRTLVADLHGIERIEISDRDGTTVVRTEARDRTPLPTAKRQRAKQILRSEGTFVGELAAPDSALYTIHPVPQEMESSRAAVAGADPNTTVETIDPAAFTVREQSTGRVVVERTGESISQQRVLVVVTTADGATRYSAVVNLDTGTVAAVARVGQNGT